MAGFFNMVDEENFKKPDFGEYYDEELMEEYLSKIKDSSPQDAAYYVEEPFALAPGYYPLYGAFVLKATPIIKATDIDGKTLGAQAEALNYVDGDTVDFYLDSVDCGSGKFTVNGIEYNDFKQYCADKIDKSTYEDATFKIRTVGINAPEVPHYNIIPVKDGDSAVKIKNNIKSNTYKNSSDYIYEVNRNSKDRTGKFIYVNGKWREIVDESRANPFASYFNYSQDNSNNVTYYTYVSKDEQTQADISETGENLGIQAKNVLLSLLSKATDIRLVIDTNQLSTKINYSELYEELTMGWEEDKKLWEVFNDAMRRYFGDTIYKYSGFTSFGQDSYKRFLGCIYVKANFGGENIWINASKYVRAIVGSSVKLMLGTSPVELANNNNVSDAFKLWSYDNTKAQYADAFFELGKADFDDRREMQKDIVGTDFDIYRDYTVMIGDCLFMVPPTSIRVINQIDSNRIPLLRSKGTMVKEAPHNDRLIELNLYFNGEYGINGVEVNTQLPNQEYTTYYMNGLRSLIAMFKFTPFMPIENAYINDTLGIEAVTLANLQIQSMPSYPKCVQVTLTLQEFNYRVYLNELPPPTPEQGYNKNMYASCINYGVMRYYYQRAIQNGEKLKGMNSLDQDYIEATMGSKTALVPMDFKEQSIRFMTLDEVWLDKMKNIKILASKQALNQVATINKETSDWAKQVGVAMKNIIDTADGYDMEGHIGFKDMYDEILKNGSAPYLLSIDLTTGTTFEAKFDISPISKSELSNLMDSVTKELDIKDQSIFKNAALKFTFTKTPDNKIKIVHDDSYKVADFFAFRSNVAGINGASDSSDWEDFSQNSNEEIYENIKDNAIDTETLLNAKFKEYPVDKIVTQQFSVSMANTISNTSLKAHSGYAPQYAGGQDSIVEFMFYTKDEETVSALNAMQQRAVNQLIEYKDIIKCWPIRIDSEFTRLCGINEVIIESIDIATVPMQPGLFAVQVRAIAVDRTVRNREALKRIDNMNNAGAINDDSMEPYVYKTYFDLNNTLSKTELYPDLELPTIDELEQTGYKFIRYIKSKNRRIYPDPDFYFVYAYAYSSQTLRKTIVDYFEEQTKEGNNSYIVKSVTNMFDNTTGMEENASVNIENPDEVIQYVSLNPELKEKVKRITELECKNLAEIASSNLAEKENQKKMSDALNNAYSKYEAAETELITMNCPTWDVCPDIKCTLAEDVITLNMDSDSANIMKQKEDAIIDIINNVLSAPIQCKSMTEARGSDAQEFKTRLTKDVKSFVNNDLENGAWKKILSVIEVNRTGDKVAKTIRGIYEAAAIALSGASEYDEASNLQQYYARTYATSYATSYEIIPSQQKPSSYIVYPYSIMLDSDTGETFCATTMEQAINSGVTFGPYQIRRYDSDYLNKFYSRERIKFESFDFLDPYYNKSLNPSITEKEITEYKNNLIKYPMYSVEAFNRVVLVWLKKLIETHSYFSIYDLKRNTLKETFEELKEEMTKLKEEYANSKGYSKADPDDSIYDEEMGYHESTSNYYDKNGIEIKNDLTLEGFDVMDELNEEINSIVGSYENSVIAGKIFLPVVCAVTHGDEFIYGRIKSSDAGTLNNDTRSCMFDNVLTANDHSVGERNFRKLARAMSATSPKIIDGIAALSTSSKTKLEEAIAERNEKLWIKACQNPSAWVLHSFYDMIVTNKRGRMLRAFPTYYMMFIDEGREIGYWKLHDNFYNMNSIAEIEVIKSRKIAADTAKIVMTNMYQTFTTDDEDIKTDYEHNVKDVWNSIFSPRILFEKEETERLNQMNINKATLRPGIRIHLRMGYSGDASELPILFNGVVAEATNGEVIEITAQGDGHEISNNMAFAGANADNAADLSNESRAFKWLYNFFTEGHTPKTLMKNVLTTKSGFWGKLVNNITNGRFFNDNLFGITHFGEIDFTAIHSDGEVMQNIYEGEGRMPWHDASDMTATSYQFADFNPPSFTIELEDKSVFDILNICAASSVEFIGAVAPFGIRSTLFHGRPHYYYAYDYALNDNGTLVEKRKPFQQYHIIDSYSDIIYNNIKASGADVKTVAVPVYKGPSNIGKTIEKKCEPMWADWDIYPEYQKTMVVNTGITWKGPKAGFLVIDNLVDKWSTNGGSKIAWRVAANSLKDSFKDIYQGEVCIIGDTSIKPYDRIYLHDITENMNGPFDVEAVVHTLSPETGFTTAIYADCISHVDSRYEDIGHMWSNQVFSQIVLVKGLQYGMSKVFYTTTKPMLNFIAKSINKAGYSAANAINKAASFVDVDELIKYSKMESTSEAFYSILGMSSSEVKVWNQLDKIKNWKNKIQALDDIEDTKTLVNSLKKLNTIKSDVSPADISKVLGEALEGNIKEGSKEAIRNTIKSLDDVAKQYGELSSNGLVTDLYNSTIRQLGEVANLSDDAKKSYDALKALKVGADMDADTVVKVLSNIDEVSDMIKLEDSMADAYKAYKVGVEAVATKTDDVVRAGKIGNAVTTGSLSTASIVTSAAVAAAEMALLYIMQKNLETWIENKMASFNVLTVYPLKKNGTAYVAGIDGHKGLVVGSPTWEKEGPIDKIINWVFGDHGTIANIALDMFVFSDEMKKIASTYKKENRMGSTIDASEVTISGLLQSMAESTASNYSTYKSMSIAERIYDLNSVNASYTFNKTRITASTMEDVVCNKKIIDELVPLTVENIVLKEYIDSGTFNIIHTLDSVDESSYGDNIIQFAYNFENVSAVGCNVATQGLNYGINKVDIPFIRPDSFQILNRLLELVEEKNTYAKYGASEGYKVWLKSGTLINSTSWASTGYMFRVEFINMSDSDAVGLFKTIADELTYSKDDVNVKMIQWKKVSGNNSFDVFICPRDEYFKLQL